MRYDLLVVGEVNPDLILRGADLEPGFGQAEKLVDDAALEIGSSSAILACGAARLGLRTAFVGVVGDDPLGRFMVDAMAARGVDVGACRVHRELRTGVSVILSRPHDRAILTFPGAIPALRAEEVPEDLLRASGHLHVGSYFLLDALRPGAPALFERAKALGLTTSLDTNYDPAGTWDGGLDEVLPHVDVLLPNETEALRLSGAQTLGEALDVLADKVDTVAAKLGPAGGEARRGDDRARRRALPIEVVDTTGAGDSFDAGFLYGWTRGWSLLASLTLATACGSLSTRASGGTAAQPALDEVRRALPEGWALPGPGDPSEVA
ncbi:MAG: carbohydrate kinase family protein [Deinococcales bacterium]